MEEFRYIRPLNWAEAAAVLGETADGKILAGGQTLIPTMKQRLATPSDLLDIQHLSELDYVSITEQTNSLDTKTKYAQTVTIPADTTHSSVAANEQLAFVSCNMQFSRSNWRSCRTQSGNDRWICCKQ